MAHNPANSPCAPLQIKVTFLANAQYPPYTLDVHTTESIWSVVLHAYIPVRLEAELVVACDLTEVSLELLQDLLVTDGLVVRDKGVQVCKLRHREGKKFCHRIQFHRARPLEGGEGRGGGWISASHV